MLRLSPLALAVLAVPATAQDGTFKGQLPIVPGAEAAVPTEKTFLFEMQADGTVRYGGRSLNADQLREALAAFAGKHPDATVVVKGVSGAHVHARMHPDLPYEALYRVLEMCSDTRVYRFHLGVRSAVDGKEKALPLFLPIDPGVGEKRESINVYVRYSTPATKDADVARQFGQAAKTTEHASLVFKPDAHVPVASVARVASIAKKNGFEHMSFTGQLLAVSEWKQGSRSFRTIVAQTGKRPDRNPGVALTAPKTHEEQVGEAFEEAAKDRARAKGTFNTAIGSRVRPPTKDEVPSKVAIGLALTWLARHQDEDGRWDTDGFMKHDEKREPTDGPGNPAQDVGITGLALLAFLGDGNTMRSGPYREVVKKGVKWLREQQGANGLFGTNAKHDFIYNHAIATIAMCEAYGLSQYRLIRKNAQKAVDYLESHRNPYALWRYQPRDNDNDASVSSWCLLAYKSAKDFGLKINELAFKNGAAMYDRWTDPRTGRCGYTRRGEPSSRHVGNHATLFPVDKGHALTGAALFTRFMLGQDPGKIRVMNQSADAMLERLPKWADDGSIDFYYWYYGSYAMYQMGGEHWQKWHKAVTRALLANQRKDGNFTGSWDPVSVWGHDGGRVYTTAMGTLCLEAVYRYRRVLKR